MLTTRLSVKKETDLLLRELDLLRLDQLPQGGLSGIKNCHNFQFWIFASNRMQPSNKRPRSILHLGRGFFFLFGPLKWLNAPW